MPLDREQLRWKLETLASQGVQIGTSSWKYQGWLDQIYTPERYHWRGKVANTRFEQNCLKGISSPITKSKRLTRMQERRVQPSFGRE